MCVMKLFLAHSQGPGSMAAIMRLRPHTAGALHNFDCPLATHANGISIKLKSEPRYNARYHGISHNLGHCCCVLPTMHAQCPLGPVPRGTPVFSCFSPLTYMVGTHHANPIQQQQQPHWGSSASTSCFQRLDWQPLAVEQQGCH